MSNPWRSSAEFDLTHYPAAVQRAIIQTRYHAERHLPRCSVCGKKRVVWGVVCHPGLKQVEVPPHLQPRPYALCAAHRTMSVEDIGAAVYGASWWRTAPGEEAIPR